MSISTSDQSNLDKLELIKRYIQSNGIRAVNLAINRLSKDKDNNFSLTPRTFAYWLKDPDRIENKDGVKKGYLDLILKELPISELAGHLGAYHFFLHQLNETDATQTSVAEYFGRYDVISNIPDQLFKFNYVVIKQQNELGFPVFEFRIHDVKTDDDLHDLKKDCDGFVFKKGDHIVLSGLSRYVSAFLMIKTVLDLTQYAMRGTCTIFDRLNNRAVTSECLFVHQSYKKSKSKLLASIANPKKIIEL